MITLNLIASVACKVAFNTSRRVHHNLDIFVNILIQNKCCQVVELNGCFFNGNGVIQFSALEIGRQIHDSTVNFSYGQLLLNSRCIAR